MLADSSDRLRAKDMSIRLVFFGVLLWNALAVSAAITIYSYTGVNHFQEDGFITILSVFQLLAISWLSYKILQTRNVTRRCVLWRDSSALWGIISLGFLFLAADEFFQIHEKIDFQIHYLFNIPETGFTDRIDDILVGIYGLAGISTLIAYRDELKTHRKALPFFICGFVLLFAMIVLDVLTNRRDILQVLFDYNSAIVLDVWLSHAEDSLKVFAEVFFIGAFYVILQKTMQKKDGAYDHTAG